MWPFERRHDVLRIGCERTELWGCLARGLVLRDQEPLAAHAFEAPALKAAAASLLARTQPNSSRTINVVLESAWLPVMPLEPGPALFARAQVEALLRHRLAQVYGPADDRGGNWEPRVEHRAGDRIGLGFALSSSLRTAVLEAASATQRRLVSIQPAFTWARGRLRGAGARDGWLLWAEQDRTLVAFLQGGRVQAFNGSAPTLTSAEQAGRLACIEALRQGITTNRAPVVAAGWHETTWHTSGGSQSGVSWIGVAAAPVTAASSAMARVARLEGAA